MGNRAVKPSRDYISDHQRGGLGTIHEGHHTGISVHVGPAELEVPGSWLKITFRTNNREWSVYRTPGQLGKMHFALHVKLFSEMVDLRAHNGKPEVDWYLFLVKHRGEITEMECEQFRMYLVWLLSKPRMRSSEHFGMFAEVSALSFMGQEKPIIEGYAHKRRGGRRFMMGGFSGIVGGVKNMFQKRYSERWFALKPDGLVYTENRCSEKILDVILFDSMFDAFLVPPTEGKRGTITPSCFRSSAVENSNFLQVQNGYRKVILRFETHARAHEWMHAIKKAHSESEWNQYHRFDSFAPPRAACTAKYLIDGEAYMGELTSALRGAKKEVYMSGWWLVPTLPLSRPGIADTVLEILDVIAEKGVKVFIVLYKELSMALTLDSLYTKAQLEALSDNIRVILHPRQLGVRAVLAWSHHQKLVVVDNETAFVGGLDICLGRFDNARHRLFDGMQPHTFPGADYCNPCLRDFVDVRNPMNNGDIVNREKEPRLPWHDVHCLLQGPVVADIVRHFVQLWNHVRTDKHKRSVRVNMLEVQRSMKPPPSSALGRLRASMARWSRGKPKVKTDDDGHSDSSSSSDSETEEKPPMAHPVDELTDAAAAVMGRSVTFHDDSSQAMSSVKKNNFSTPNRVRSQLSFDGLLRSESSVSADDRGASTVQFLRSGARWSLGLPTECSIMNAYMQLIGEAKSFIYIENQFFVTSSSNGNNGLVKNRIGRAIADRILRSVDANENFKIYVVMPVMPAFENAQLFNPNGFVTRLTLEYQYQALVRGSDSILGHLASVLGKEKAEEVFKTHMVVCGLRQIDTWPDGTVLTEQLYIHSKVMIVDDRFAIIGSANINDRSMLGDRDSEIAVVIEDPLFALHLRQDLWREHFGLIKSHEALTIRSDYPEVQDSLRSLIRQPASDACFDLWRTTAADNALIYRDLFGVVPCDSVRTRADFEKRMIANVTRPRVRLGTPEAERLSNLVGRVVELPLRFLEGEASLQDPMPTTASLCPKEVFS